MPSKANWGTESNEARLRLKVFMDIRGSNFMALSAVRLTFYRLKGLDFSELC